MGKQRIIELQKSLKIAREALERIKCGTTRAESIAEDALDKMWKLEPKQLPPITLQSALKRPYR